MMILHHSSSMLLINAERLQSRMVLIVSDSAEISPVVIAPRTSIKDSKTAGLRSDRCSVQISWAREKDRSQAADDAEMAR